MRIRFDPSLAPQFAELAGVYEAAFAQEAEALQEAKVSAERSQDGYLIVEVTDDLPAFLSGKGFPFEVVEE